MNELVFDIRGETGLYAWRIWRFQGNNTRLAYGCCTMDLAQWEDWDTRAAVVSKHVKQGWTLSNVPRLDRSYYMGLIVALCHAGRKMEAMAAANEQLAKAVADLKKQKRSKKCRS